MDRVERWLQNLHDQKITNDFDRIVIVLGEEGAGKSTFILGAMSIWYQVLGRAPVGERPDPERLLSHVVFDSREDFKQTLLDSSAKDPIAAMDAAHLLHNKEAMHGGQVDIEKTLLDIRIENYLIFLGYQDWSDVPKQLRTRRAKNVLHIPSRGTVHGYSRSSMDKREEQGEWPDPDLKDTFPPLDGTDLWEQFRANDHERKKNRLVADQEPSAEDAARREAMRVAIRCKRMDMTHREVSKIVDYSKSWVGQVWGDWKDGELPELFDDEEPGGQTTTANRGTA